MSGCGLSAAETEMNNQSLFSRSTHLGKEDCLMEDESSSRPSFSTHFPYDLEGVTSPLEGVISLGGQLKGIS